MKKTLLLILFLLLPTVVSSPSLAVQQELETQTPKNQSEVLKAGRRAHFLELHEEYKEKSQDSDQIRQAFIKLHLNYIDWHSKAPERITTQQLYEQAVAFTKLQPQPKDPLSLAETGRIIFSTKLSTRLLDDFKMVAQAESQMEGYSVAAQFRAICTLHLFLPHIRIYKKQRIREIINKHASLMIQWFNTGNASESEQRLCCSELIHFFDIRDYPTYQDAKSRNLKQAYDKDHENIQPWLQKIIMGQLHYRAGWIKRGTGRASTVDEDAWEEFKWRLEKARGFFEEAYELHPERPESASFMIYVAAYGGFKPDEETWFNRTIEAQFDYMPAYRKRMWTLRPRWGGSHEEMLDFGRKCKATGRYDTPVPYVFLEAIYDVKSELGDWKEMKEMELYPEVVEVCDAYEKFAIEHDNPRFPSLQARRAEKFCFAYLWGLMDKACEVYEKHDGDIEDYSVFLHMDVGYKIAKSLAFASQGEASELVQSIQDRIEYGLNGVNRSQVESLQLMEDISIGKMFDDVPQSDDFFQIKQELVDKELQFHDGQWVDLEFTPDMRHWAFYGNRETFSYESPSSILVDSKLSTKHYIAYNTSFPPPYEVTLTIESIESYQQWNMLKAGLVCGRMYGPRTGRLFWVNGMRGKMGVAIPNKPIGISEIARKRTVNISVNVFEGYYEFRKLGKQQKELFRQDAKFVPGRLGLCICPWLVEGGKVRYKNLRVRKINASVPPPADDFLARIEYYRDRLKTTKSYAYHANIGWAQLCMEKYEDALQTYLDIEKLYPQNYYPTMISGRLLAILKRYDDALESYESALKKCGKDKFARYTVLKYLMADRAICQDEPFGDPAEALKLAEEFLTMKLQPRVQDFASVAAVYAANEQFEEAIKFCRKGIRKVKTAKAEEVLGGMVKAFKKGNRHEEFVW